MHRVLIILCVALCISDSAFSRPRGGFFRPHFFSPETEAALFDVPLYLHFQELAHRLSRLAWQLRREAFNDRHRRDYQKTLDELAASRDELVAFMRQQNLAVQEVLKLENADVEQIDSGTVAEDGGDGASDESAFSLNTLPPLRLEAAPTEKVTIGYAPQRGRIPSRIPDATTAASPDSKTERRDGATPVDSVRFRGDPKETAFKFGSFFSKSLPARWGKSPEVSRIDEGESAPDSVLPQNFGNGGSSRDAQGAPSRNLRPFVAQTAPDEREDDLNIDSPQLAMSGGDAGGLPMLREARRTLGHLLDSNVSVEGGGWMLLALVLAAITMAPFFMRRRVMESIDLSTMGARPDAPRLHRGSNFAVVWDMRLHCWTLTQRLDHLTSPRVVAELREGSVVYGNLLGRSAADRYRLNDIDEWLPTQEPERLVLDLRQGMRHYG